MVARRLLVGDGCGRNPGDFVVPDVCFDKRSMRFALLAFVSAVSFEIPFRDVI